MFGRGFRGIVLAITFLVSGLSGELTIFWPDVEQGACMLIIGPKGDAILVDAGTLGRRDPDQPIVPWLISVAKEYPDFKLRYIVVTHYHEDHICWIDEIINAGLLEPDGLVYDRGGSYSSNAYSQYYSSVSDRRRAIKLGESIDLGNDAKLICLAVGGTVCSAGNISTSDENNLSIGLLLSYQQFQLWIGGDLGSQVEYLLKNVVPDVDVYVVHHHGSAGSSSSSFLSAIKPEVSICQVGNNPYGHPANAAIHRILSTPDTDRDPNNGTPLVILQNCGSFQEILSNVYIADPDEEGPLPGMIKLTTDGRIYTITASGIQKPIQLATDGFPSPKCQASIILEEVQLVYNNSVGNEWRLFIEINDKEFPGPFYELPKTIETFQFTHPIDITVTAVAIEKDKYSDIGRASASFRLSCPPSISFYTTTLEVLVVEDRGRYAGNTALWRFKVKVEVQVTSLEGIPKGDCYK